MSAEVSKEKIAELAWRVHPYVSGFPATEVPRRRIVLS